MHGEYDKNIVVRIISVFRLVVYRLSQKGRFRYSPQFQFQNGSEAACLVNQLQMYYGGKHPEKTEMVKRFQDKPAEFKHMDLVAQLESLDLSSLVPKKDSDSK